MKTTAMFTALLLMGKLVIGQAQLEPISKQFPIQWKTHIGNTTYKTNVAFTDSTLIIGSNGHHYMDYMLDDDFGVNVINRKNGKVISKIANEGFGDMDVNGVLIYLDKLYFGNDNEEFLCTDMQGNIIWRKAVSGDVESEPVLIKNGIRNQIIYATETGEIRAVNPKDGSTFWVYYDKNFSGWKPTDSRFVFKVKAYASGGDLFNTKPQTLDVNNDGIDDLIYSQYYSDVTCVDGASGKLLWEKEVFSNYSKSEMIPCLSKNNMLNVECVKVGTKTTERVESWWGTYLDTTDVYENRLVLYDKNGNVKKHKKLPFNNYDKGFNSIVLDANVIIPYEDSIMLVSKNMDVSYIKNYVPIDIKYWNDHYQTVNRFTNDQIAIGSFNYKDFGECVITVSQYDKGTEDKGAVNVISLDKNRVVARYQLPSKSEFRPLIEDVNKDGILDLLINCRDGYLYCYSLGTETQPTLVAK